MLCLCCTVCKISSTKWRCFIPILFFQYWKTRHWDCMPCLVCLALCRFHLCGTKRIPKGLHVWSVRLYVGFTCVAPKGYRRNYMSCLSGFMLVLLVWHQKDTEGITCLVFWHPCLCLTSVSPVWYRQEAEGTAWVCCDLMRPNCNLHHGHYTAEGCIFSLDYTAHFSPQLVSWVWIKYSTFELVYEDVTCMGSSLAWSNQQGRSAPDSQSSSTQKSCTIFKSTWRYTSFANIHKPCMCNMQ